MRFHRFALWLATCAAAVAALLFTRESRAFPDYASGCNTCHGTFNSGTYVSLKDGSSWGTDLMSGHLNNILGSTSNARCNVCHSGTSKAVVLLNSSNGTGTLPGLGCMGCHGRAADNTSANPDFGSKTGYGAGLRQHHYIKGVTLCAGCHNDANPANYTPVGENVPPPYYGNTTFPLIPTNPCNPNGTEDRIASALGLDNDGDGIYDMSDPDCTSCTPTTCAAQGKDCGSLTDGCGGLLSCGTCNSPDTCGGGGTPNVCGCTPDSCASLGVQCGSVGDGCGGSLDCGGCAAPATCSAGVCVTADAGADSGVPDAAEASTDAFVDAQQDSAAEAANDASNYDATANDAANHDAASNSDATSDAANYDAASNDAANHDAASNNDAANYDAASNSDATSDAAAGDAGAKASSGNANGCACRFAESEGPPGYAWWLLALFAMLLVRTRRRRRRQEHAPQA